MKAGFAKFKVPGLPLHGRHTVSHEGQTFPVVDGIVECPIEIGRAAEWVQVGAEASASDSATTSKASATKS